MCVSTPTVRKQATEMYDTQLQLTRVYVSPAVPPVQHKGSGDGVDVLMSYRV